MVTYEDKLPLNWRRVDMTPEESEHFQTNNRYVLNALASLEERLSVSRVSEEHPALGEELMRIDAMLHLLLNMMAHKFADEGALPAELRIKIAVDELLFIIPPERSKPQPGTMGTVEIFFHSSIPEPFRLYGQFRDTRDQDGETWQVFQPTPALEGDLRNELQRLVFRHHRRWIAARRNARALGGQKAGEEAGE